MDNELKHGLLSVLRNAEARSNNPNHLLPWLISMAVIIIILCLSLSGTVSTGVSVYTINRSTEKQMKQIRKLGKKKPKVKYIIGNVAQRFPKKSHTVETIHDGLNSYGNFYTL